MPPNTIHTSWRGTPLPENLWDVPQEKGSIIWLWCQVHNLWRWNMSCIMMAVMVHTYLSMPYSSRHSFPASNIRPRILALADWCCGLGLLMRVLGLERSLKQECRYEPPLLWQLLAPLSSWQNFRDGIMNGNESMYFSLLFHTFWRSPCSHRVWLRLQIFWARILCLPIAVVSVSCCLW